METVLFYENILWSGWVQQPSSFYPIIMYFNPFSGMSTILKEQMGIDIFMNLIFHDPKTPALYPLYVNIGVSLLVSIVLLGLSALKINPMMQFKGIFRRKKKV